MDFGGGGMGGMPGMGGMGGPGGGMDMAQMQATMSQMGGGGGMGGPGGDMVRWRLSIQQQEFSYNPPTPPPLCGP